jgi:uncharacterized protein YbjT (DUF2867 family)
MQEKKIITVMGATGAQGGGLVRAILNDSSGEFSVRAVTRNTSSDKAKKMADLGAELVSADVEDKSSIVEAFKGAYGAFCVTFYWEHFSPEKELQHAKNMAEAAGEAKLKHVIWSTLEDTRNWVPLEDKRMPTLMGKYKTPHFDAKGEADRYFLESGVPVTFMVASFFMENFIFFGQGPKKGVDGKLSLTFPMGNKKLALIASEDIGKTAYTIFKKGNEFAGKRIGVAGAHLTITEIADKFSKALGKEVVYNSITPEVYRGFGFPGSDDIANMFQFYADFESDSLKLRDISLSRSLNPELQDFDTWLKNNISKVPVE